MDLQPNDQRVNPSQVIFVPHKDTVRLLEVYVKRSLSVNDGSPEERRYRKKEKWVTKRQRRHSSDPSLHQLEGLKDIDVGLFSPAKPSKEVFEIFPEEPEKKETRKNKKNKKPSFWKSVLGFFSWKSTEEGDEKEDAPTETPKTPAAEGTSEEVLTCMPSPATGQKKVKRIKSLKRRFSMKRLSLTKPNRPDKDGHHVDVGGFEAVVSVEPTYSYYEKVSEEMEKIVSEVKEKEESQPRSDEEVINKLITLLREEGDAIDEKLKQNSTLSNIFQGMTYSSFQKLADAYLEEEVSPSNSPLTVLPTAPELVKLAFTLDFTARIAALSRHNISHITSLGNRYLLDRFEYKQACTDNPVST